MSPALRAEHQEQVEVERRERDRQARQGGGKLADPTADRADEDALFDDASRDGSEGARDFD